MTKLNPIEITITVLNKLGPHRVARLPLPYCQDGVLQFMADRRLAGEVAARLGRDPETVLQDARDIADSLIYPVDRIPVALQVAAEHGVDYGAAEGAESRLALLQAAGIGVVSGALERDSQASSVEDAR